VQRDQRLSATVIPRRLLAIGVLISGAIVFVPLPAQATLTPEGFERCLFDEINEDRAQAGVRALIMDTQVNAKTRTYSMWMSENEFRHATTAERAALLPNWAIPTAENIARTGDSPAQCAHVHELFMESDGHSANILSTNAKFVALGAHLDDSSVWWITEIFFIGDGGFGYSSYCAAQCSSDEMFFYMDNGTYRYYDIRADGSLGSPITGGGYSAGWDSITAVDLDGDGRDEMFFYMDNGLYRYYDLRSDGRLGPLITGGSGYSAGWDSITAVDLDGDGRDEMFFYMDNGLYRYYDLRSDGRLGPLITGGSGYSDGWDSITAVDLDGDGRDEMFFYMDNGLYRYYDLRSDGRLGSPIQGGDGYSDGWDSITAVNLN
jgi:hypothetical protein